MVLQLLYRAFYTRTYRAVFVGFFTPKIQQKNRQLGNHKQIPLGNSFCHQTYAKLKNVKYQLSYR